MKPNKVSAREGFTFLPFELRIPHEDPQLTKYVPIEGKDGPVMLAKHLYTTLQAELRRLETVRDKATKNQNLAALGKSKFVGDYVATDTQKIFALVSDIKGKLDAELVAIDEKALAELDNLPQHDDWIKSKAVDFFRDLKPTQHFQLIGDLFESEDYSTLKTLADAPAFLTGMRSDDRDDIISRMKAGRVDEKEVATIKAAKEHIERAERYVRGEAESAQQFKAVN